jgi:hypothetical protein
MSRGGQNRWGKEEIQEVQLKFTRVNTHIFHRVDHLDLALWYLQCKAGSRDRLLRHLMVDRFDLNQSPKPQSKPKRRLARLFFRPPYREGQNYRPNLNCARGPSEAYRKGGITTRI